MFSRFKLTLWDGQTIAGMALDAGPTGKLIDVYVDTIKEAITLGRKKGITLEFVK
jgi:hypothetical protein